jgi:hypothetical protein
VKLEKATIEVLGATPVPPIVVLFNPFEYSIDRSNVYKATAVPGLSGPLIQFINGDADLLQMELFLDDYTDKPKDRSSVQTRLEAMAKLLEIDSKLHAPPIVQFLWGKLTFKAVIEKLSPQDHSLPAGRHAGPRHTQRHVQGIQDAAGADERSQARVGGQNQTARIGRPRQFVGDGRARVWRRRRMAPDCRPQRPGRSARGAVGRLGHGAAAASGDRKWISRTSLANTAGSTRLRSWSRSANRR